MKRRDFLRVGALGLGLSNIPFSDSVFAENNIQTTKSVIFIWLGGGCSHIESFDPKPDSPVEFRSTVGNTFAGHNNTKNGRTSFTDIMLGGLWTNLIHEDRHMNVVRSFTHGNSSHATATHWVMTGYNTRENGNQQHPGNGSIVSRHLGTNAPNGIPTYIKYGNIYGDNASYIGANYNPFDAAQGKRNLTLGVEASRLNDRISLLKSIQQERKHYDNNVVDSYQDQAHGMLLSNLEKAFEPSEKDRERYGKSTVGDQLIAAKQLTKAGTKFVSVHYGGWDMHQKIKENLEVRVPPLDKALAMLTDDLVDEGRIKDTLIVITGEFGRTPKINVSGGRDHWGRLNTLAFIGGDYDGGRVIGKSSKNAEYAEENPVYPMDVRATIFDHMNIPKDLMYDDHAGRPQFMLPEGNNILA